MKLTKVDTIANRIYEGLRICDITQADLHRRTDISRAAISQYVTGKTQPPRERISILANALSCSPLWLMGYNVPYDYREQELSPSRTQAINDARLLRKFHRLDFRDQNLILNLMEDMAKTNSKTNLQ